MEVELYNLEKDNEEWYNLAYEKEYLNLINDFRNEIPQNPISLPEESLIELQEHHIPPVISREFYFSDKRREWLKDLKINTKLDKVQTNQI